MQDLKQTPQIMRAEFGGTHEANQQYCRGDTVSHILTSAYIYKFALVLVYPAGKLYNLFTCEGTNVVKYLQDGTNDEKTASFLHHPKLQKIKK